MAMFDNGKDKSFEELPLRVRRTFKPIIRQLMEKCPTKRLSVKDVALRLGLF